MNIKFIPEGDFKKEVRSVYYSFKYHKDIKMMFLKKEGYYVYKLPDGRVIKSYDNLAGDFGIFIKGYMQHYKPKETDIVVDAGAYVGAFTLFIADKVKHVILFEPEHENYKKIIRNLYLNKIKNVTVIQKGLWENQGFLKFLINGASSRIEQTKVNPHEPNKSNNYTMIEVIDLDTELRARGIKQVDFIKMDIEGAELRALKGMNEILKKPIKLAIASYHLLNGEQTCNKVEEFLKERGFNVKTEFPEHLTTYGEKE